MTPRTIAEHIELAKAELAGDEPELYAHLAIAHALVAIAELMAINVTDTIIDATTRGAMAGAEALATVVNAFSPGVATGRCYAHGPSCNDLNCAGA